MLFLCNGCLYVTWISLLTMKNDSVLEHLMNGHKWLNHPNAFLGMMEMWNVVMLFAAVCLRWSIKNPNHCFTSSLIVSLSHCLIENSMDKLSYGDTLTDMLINLSHSII